METDALVRIRDGIAGAWKDPTTVVPHLTFGRPSHMERWSPFVRSMVVDFELVSRLAFSHDDTGKVVLWHAVREDSSPLAPPSVTYKPLAKLSRPPMDTFKSQLSLVNNYTELRSERASEILAQLGLPFAFLSSVTYITPSHTPATIELLAAALRLASWAALRSKHTLACRRPSELSPLIQPMIQTPAHGSFPSGHGTEAFISATVLYALLKAVGRSDDSWQDQLMRLANRIAVNRTVAGVHFPVDSMAGCLLGKTLGRYFVARCLGMDKYRAWSFEGETVPANADFDFHDVSGAFEGTRNPGFITDSGEQSDPGLSSPILAWLWNKARAEWVIPADGD
jgi:hypothetical protein